MASIFRKDDNYVETPNRNTYDMSFQNNLTLDIGSLRPCFCQPVMPGDSWSIESVHGLRFMPLTYPIQTRMKSSIHFFYVRNRNLWKDWPDFIGKTKEGLTPPYIKLTEQNRKMFETCQLADFMGIPTKVYGLTNSFNLGEARTQRYDFSAGSYEVGTFASVSLDEYMNLVNQDAPYSQVVPENSYSSYVYNTPYQWVISKENLLKYSNTDGATVETRTFEFDLEFTPDDDPTWYNGHYSSMVIYMPNGQYLAGHRVLTENNDSNPIKIRFVLRWRGQLDNMPDGNYLLMFVPQVNSVGASAPETTISVARMVQATLEGVDVADLELSQVPWRSDANPSGIPISALPFRAYESIYNSFYRNAENNPLMINGVPEYNKWLRTNEGGADTNFYPIMYHNWEDDFLTTAVPSPQQGNAPLVGLSGTPTLTVAHDDGTTTQMQLDVNDEGQVTAVSAVSGDAATTSALMEAVSYGIAINDLRNVNSFQRWLENNIRRGYKYRDQIKTHYGVSVRYDELDMPEFIGGISEPVMVNQISQTVATEEGALGDMAGQASVFGQSKNITHYCDEHGFIIGIICVKPVANYSQLLPKFFNVTDTFDYYFPEFGHIGMQPITYAEVTPLQANLEGKLNDVFGYQRAWYDLISKTDEVHGLFRDGLRNFLINRTFDGTPELGKEFTVMSPDQINDVFAYTENTDKILGQVFFKCSKKTPIPLYGIPKLE